jgi:tetratricopeptide (TPR) repeat protein
MSEAVSNEIKLIDVSKPLGRALLVLLVLMSVAFSWFGVQWYVGDTIAEYAPGLEDGGIDSARVSVRLAPDDPLTHWSVATLLKNSLAEDQLPEALTSFEEAARLSPNDYRLWMDLGRGRSQAGDLAGAEKALRQAVVLAPRYSYPRWYLGNLLLREGQNDQAFAELRQAADTEASLRPQIFNLASHVYGDDLEKIKSVLGGQAEARTQLVSYLVSRNRVDDAVRVWSSLSPSERVPEKATSDALINALISAKRFQSAYEIYRQSVPSPGSETGGILNGSFEQEIPDAGQSPFGWQIKSLPPQAQINLDKSVRHGGERSLRVLFKSTSQLVFNNISQLSLTDPSTAYRLEFWVRTEDLKSVGTPLIEIVDPVSGEIMGKSDALHTVTADWQPVTIDFKTGPKTEAVTLRTNRASCGTGKSICPIFGVVWFDDFTLQRISANNSTGTSKN